MNAKISVFVICFKAIIYISDHTTVPLGAIINPKKAAKKGGQFDPHPTPHLLVFPKMCFLERERQRETEKDRVRKGERVKP